MPEIIDLHTHAFPEKLAATAIPALEKEGDVAAKLDGTVSALLESMDRAGIARSVLCSIATRPEQFDAILSWSAVVRSARIIPLPSLHPADANPRERIRRIRGEGFQGIKMHPYYQDFFLDEDRLMPIYEALCAENLLLVMHTGFDIAFPPTRRAVPQQIITVLDRFPGLKMVTTHMGSWKLWDEVENLLVGRPIYMDISFSLDFMDEEQARRIFSRHPKEYLLFGTDSPWDDQKYCVEKLKNFELGQELQDRILGENAAVLLQSTAA